jgi:hypothetical protein
MKRICSLVPFLVLVSLNACFATPPTSISLSYDLGKGTLHVEAVHPSFDLEKSYVRLMDVYLNGTQVSELNYFKQGDYDKFTDDVPLTAQVGDVIKVDIFCTLGGEMAQELTVKKPEAAGPDQGADTPSANSTANTADNS